MAREKPAKDAVTDAEADLRRYRYTLALVAKNMARPAARMQLARVAGIVAGLTEQTTKQGE